MMSLVDFFWSKVKILEHLTFLAIDKNLGKKIHHPKFRVQICGRQLFYHHIHCVGFIFYQRFHITSHGFINLQTHICT